MKLVIILMSLSTILFGSSRFSREAVVKIESGRCGMSQKTMKGSGILIREGSNIYVITSEHVIYHSNSGFCHRVSSESFSRMEARLIQVDWGMGLALLKLVDDVSINLPTLSTLNSGEIRQGESVFIFGFPYSSEKLLQSPKGFLLSTQSDRALIPFVKVMYEAIRVYVEFGMSGGIAVSEDLTSFIGIISHQRLVQVAGSGSKVVEIENALTPASDNAFIIPANVVYFWANKIINHHELGVPTIVRDAKSEHSAPGRSGGGQQVYSSGLKFISTGLTNDEAPVGGSEGVGGRTINGKPISVSLVLDQDNHLAQLQIPGRESWTQEVRERLLKQEKVKVVGFLDSSESLLGLRKRNIHSLPEFFKLLNEPALKPITISESSFAGLEDEREILIKAISADGREMGRLLNELSNSPSEKHFEVQSLLNELRIISELLQSQDFALVPSSKLDPRQSEAWKFLFLANFELSRDLMAVIYRVKTHLDRIRF